MKTFKQIIAEVEEPKSDDEKRFKAKHVIAKTADRNGNGDDVFNGSKQKKDKSKPAGYHDGDDKKVYEEKQLDEKIAFVVPEGIEKEGVAHFMGAAAAAHKAGKSSFSFGGKSYPVKIKGHVAKKVNEDIDARINELRQHAIDLDETVDEGWDDMLKMVKDRQKQQGTGNFDKKKVSTGTVFQRKWKKEKEQEK